MNYKQSGRYFYTGFFIIFAARILGLHFSSFVLAASVSTGAFLFLIYFFLKKSKVLFKICKIRVYLPYESTENK